MCPWSEWHPSIVSYGSGMFGQEPSSRVKQNCTQIMIVPSWFHNWLDATIDFVHFYLLLMKSNSFFSFLLSHLVIWYNMIQFKRHHNQKIRITLAKIWLKQFRFCPFPICQTKSIEIISHALLNRCVRLCYLNAVLCKYVSNWFGNRIYLSLCADNNSTTFDIQRFAHHETRNTIPACWPLKDGVY